MELTQENLDKVIEFAKKEYTNYLKVKKFDQNMAAVCWERFNAMCVMYDKLLYDTKLVNNRLGREVISRCNGEECEYYKTTRAYMMFGKRPKDLNKKERSECIRDQNKCNYYIKHGDKDGFDYKKGDAYLTYGKRYIELSPEEMTEYNRIKKQESRERKRNNDNKK